LIKFPLFFKAFFVQNKKAFLKLYCNHEEEEEEEEEENEKRNTKNISHFFLSLKFHFILITALAFFFLLFSK
jgi:hypothetical protein